MKRTRKVKSFRFSLPLFVEVFQTGKKHHVEIMNGFPKDAEVLDVRFNAFNNSMDVLVTSKKFPIVKEGKQIPEDNVTIYQPASEHINK